MISAAASVVTQGVSKLKHTTQKKYTNTKYIIKNIFQSSITSRNKVTELKRKMKRRRLLSHKYNEKKQNKTKNSI